MVNYAETLATLALVISLGSPAIAFYVACRDRPRLRITAQLVAPPGGARRIVVDFVNEGRRPVILRLLGGSGAEKLWSAHYLKSPTDGVRIGEHERHQETFDLDDTEGILPDGDFFPFESLWVEDSLGVRYPIPKSRKLIVALREGAGSKTTSTA